MLKPSASDKNIAIWIKIQWTLILFSGNLWIIDLYDFNVVTGAMCFKLNECSKEANGALHLTISYVNMNSGYSVECSALSMVPLSISFSYLFLNHTPMT